jgi:hypothetical protein
MCVSSIPGLFLISFCCWANFEGILSGMMTGCSMLRAHRGVDTRCSRSLWAGRAWVHLAVEDEGWRIRTQGGWEPLLGDTFLVLPSCAFSQSIFLPGIYYVSFLDWAGISIHQWLAGGLEPGITKNPSWRERLLYARRTHTHTHTDTWRADRWPWADPTPLKPIIPLSTVEIAFGPSEDLHIKCALCRRSRPNLRLCLKILGFAWDWFVHIFCPEIRRYGICKASCCIFIDLLKMICSHWIPLVHPPFEESTRLIPYLKSIRLFYWMWGKGIL